MAVANSLKRAEHQSVVPKDLARCKQSLEGLFTTVLRKCWSIPLFNLEGSVVGLLVTFRNLEGPNTTEDHGQQQHRKTHRQLSKPLLTTLPLRREYLPAQLKYRGTLQTSQAENGVYTELEAIDVLRGEGLSSSKALGISAGAEFVLRDRTCTVDSNAEAPAKKNSQEQRRLRAELLLLVEALRLCDQARIPCFVDRVVANERKRTSPKVRMSPQGHVPGSRQQLLDELAGRPTTLPECFHSEISKWESPLRRKHYLYDHKKVGYPTLFTKLNFSMKTQHLFIPLEYAHCLDGLFYSIITGTHESLHLHTLLGLSSPCPPIWSAVSFSGTLRIGCFFEPHIMPLPGGSFRKDPSSLNLVADNISLRGSSKGDESEKLPLIRSRLQLEPYIHDCASIPGQLPARLPPAIHSTSPNGVDPIQTTGKKPLALPEWGCTTPVKSIFQSLCVARPSLYVDVQSTLLQRVRRVVDDVRLLCWGKPEPELAIPAEYRSSVANSAAFRLQFRGFVAVPHLLQRRVSECIPLKLDLLHPRSPSSGNALQSLVANSRNKAPTSAIQKDITEALKHVFASGQWSLEEVAIVHRGPSPTSAGLSKPAGRDSLPPLLPVFHGVGKLSFLCSGRKMWIVYPPTSNVWEAYRHTCGHEPHAWEYPGGGAPAGGGALELVRQSISTARFLRAAGVPLVVEQRAGCVAGYTAGPLVEGDASSIIAIETNVVLAEHLSMIAAVIGFASTDAAPHKLYSGGLGLPSMDETLKQHLHRVMKENQGRHGVHNPSDHLPQPEAPAGSSLGYATGSGSTATSSQGPNIHVHGEETLEAPVRHRRRRGAAGGPNKRRRVSSDK